MFFTALAIIGGAGLATAHPFVARDVAAFPAGTSWDILLSKGDAIGNIKQKVVAEHFAVIDIDLFDTDKASVQEMKSSKQVICYFSAGSKEGWRPDAGDFKQGDTGKGLDGWPDEVWVNVKSQNVRNIMSKRIKLAADNGCTAIDPDNVDGFDGSQDGFGYGKSAYVDYVKFLAQQAKDNGLAMGLKNAVDLIPDVVNDVQFAVNEQCHQYSGECALYKPFTDANKAVFNIEYGGNHCDNPSGVKLSTLIKPEDQGLNTLGGACAGQNPGTPSNGNSPAPSKTTATPVQTSRAAVSQPPSNQAPQPTPTNTGEEQGEPEEGEPEEGEPEENEPPAPQPTKTHQWGGFATSKPKPRPWGYHNRPHWGGYHSSQAGHHNNNDDDDDE